MGTSVSVEYTWVCDFNPLTRTISDTIHTKRDFNPRTTDAPYFPIHKPAFYRLCRAPTKKKKSISMQTWDCPHFCVYPWCKEWGVSYLSPLFGRDYKYIHSYTLTQTCLHACKIFHTDFVRHIRGILSYLSKTFIYSGVHAGELGLDV